MAIAGAAPFLGSRPPAEAALARDGVSGAPSEERLRALVRRDARDVARYVTRLGVPAAEVDDVVQDALVVVAARLPELPGGVERAFFFATALRIARNARRGKHRRERTREALARAGTDPAPAVEERIDDQNARAHLEEAFDRLPSDTRLVFLLSEIHELPVRRVAERLALPSGTVASRLRRARQSFAEWSARATAATAFEEARARVSARRVDFAGHRQPELVSWWASRGESDALQALVSIYDRAHPDAAVRTETASGPSVAQDQLRSRVARGLPPPDTFQVAGGTDLVGWVQRGTARDRLEPIDCLFSSEGWRGAFPREVLDLVTHDGRLYGVPVNIHRTNVLFYNRRLFDEHGLAPPSSLEDMHAAAAALRERGVLPFALGYREPSALRSLAFETVLVAVAGGEYYRDLLSGRAPVDEATLRTMLAHLGRILDNANRDAQNGGWCAAIEMLRAGRAAMTITGDWANGYLKSSGAASRYDPIDHVASPGARGAYIFVTDTFGLPRRAVHRAGAIDLLRVFGSKEGQDAFNPVKGSIPARIDADLSRYDAASRAAAYAFHTSPRFPIVASLAPGGLTRALDAAVVDFARSRDPRLVLETLRAHARSI